MGSLLVLLVLLIVYAQIGTIWAAPRAGVDLQIPLLATERWIAGGDATKLAQFRERAYESLALDHAGELVYLAPTRINLGLTIERWPELLFRETREHLAAAA